LKKIEVGLFLKFIGFFEQFGEDNDIWEKCHQFDGKLLCETFSRPETLHIRANSIVIELSLLQSFPSIHTTPYNPEDSDKCQRRFLHQFISPAASVPWQIFYAWRSGTIGHRAMTHFA
jgi:hypothetical protein